MKSRPILNNTKDVFREAGRLQLISSVESWFEYQRARNLTSHTYSQKVADEVYVKACEFSEDLKKLILQLEAAI